MAINSPPSNLQPTVISDTEIDLSWDAVDIDPEDTLIEYRVHRTTTTNPTFPSDYTQIDTTPPGTTTYSDTGLAQGEAYHYRVTAFVEVNQ